MASTGGLTGRLLVARPRLVDPNFFRTVILVLDHGDDGAFGVVLNRPLPVDVARVLPSWHDHVAAPSTLFQGGPVGLDAALGVALLGPAGTPPGVDRVAGPFGLVDLDADPLGVVPSVRGVRIFAGHSGWSGGQLEEELEERSWYVLDAEPTDLLVIGVDALWRRVLRRQGGDLAIVANHPADVALN